MSESLEGIERELEEQMAKMPPDAGVEGEGDEDAEFEEPEEGTPELETEPSHKTAS